jgi:hypothetical protein
MELFEIAILFRYEVGKPSLRPYMVINGSYRYEQGDRIVGAYGIDEATLDERFWKYLCYMALRRYHGIGDGWVTARELNQLFDKKSLTGPQATQKHFQRILRLYDSEDIESKTYLIQYRAKKGKVDLDNRGVSVGPYRISVGPPRLTVSPINCWGYILGPEPIVNVTIGPVNEAVIHEIDRQYSTGNYFEARILLLQALGNLLIHENEKNLQLIADLWKQLSAAEMFLGLTNQSIRSARNAIFFYKKIGRNSYRIAQCLHILANAQGQVSKYHEALKSLKDGEFQLRERVSSSQNISNQLAYFMIDIGKNLSHIGNTFPAAKTLEKVKHKILSGEDEDPVVAIHMRLAQHYMRSHELANAEKMLSAVDQNPEQLSVSEYSLYMRVAAEFCYWTSQWDEARAWCNKAIEYAIEKEMRNEMRRIESIAKMLREVGQWDDEV